MMCKPLNHGHLPFSRLLRRLSSLTRSFLLPFVLILKTLMHLNMNLIVCFLVPVNDKRPSLKLDVCSVVSFYVIYGEWINEMLDITKAIPISDPSWVLVTIELNPQAIYCYKFRSISLRFVFAEARSNDKVREVLKVLLAFWFHFALEILLRKLHQSPLKYWITAEIMKFDKSKRAFWGLLSDATAVFSCFCH
jgi:hypothetical protein